MLLALVAGITIDFATLKQQILAERNARMANVQTVKPSPLVTVVTSPTPTVTPNRTPTLAPTQALTANPSVAQTSGDQIKNFIMAEINSYRRTQGLAGVQTDKYTCEFAKVRAEEISKGFNHDGFNQRVQNKSLPYPSYHLVTENIALNPNYNNVVQSWINSPGHAKNMRADTPFVCVEQYGNFYAYEGWRS